jgi:hypothetical protein
MTCVTFSSTGYPNVTDVFQVYLNLVLDDAVEEKPGNVRDPIGMVVIRGNAVVMLEVRVPSTVKMESFMLTWNAGA